VSSGGSTATLVSLLLLSVGEDVGHYGGSYKVTYDLYKKFGDMRVLDTPICGECLWAREGEGGYALCPGLLQQLHSENNMSQLQSSSGRSNP
jgi:hypothetical protein